MLVYNGVHIGVSWGFNGGSDEARFMSLSIYREGAEEFPGLVKGLFDGEGFLSPVNQGVEFFQPRES